MLPRKVLRPRTVISKLWLGFGDTVLGSESICVLGLVIPLPDQPRVNLEPQDLPVNTVGSKVEGIRSSHLVRPFLLSAWRDLRTTVQGHFSVESGEGESRDVDLAKSKVIVKNELSDTP